jgi:PiT family inorganic phosphate transporter
LELVLTPFLIAALLAGLYMAWNIGANDVANAMGTSVGSRAITYRQAILIAAIFEFGGAVVFGKHVTETIRKGIVDPSRIASPEVLAFGAFSALLAAGIWLTIATWAKLPVSTTHSIVGAMAGFGIAAQGIGVVNWGKMSKIVASWVVSPIAGALVAFLLFTAMRHLLLKRVEDRQRIERIFGKFQIATACFVAFAHGSNDVANAVGPLAAALTFSQGEAVEVAAKLPVPKWLLAFGGFGIVLGLATWGYRVMGTIGERVTQITPTRGFTAEFSAASVVLANSQIGMPISTTHTLVGSVIGVGLARGIKALNLKIIRDIILSWLATVPFAALVAGITFKVLMYLR